MEFALNASQVAFSVLMAYHAAPALVLSGLWTIQPASVIKMKITLLIMLAIVNSAPWSSARFAVLSPPASTATLDTL